MGPLRRVEHERSLNHERQRALLAQEERTDADYAEMRELEARSANLEVEYRAALALEPATETREITSDPEMRERQELRGRASLTNYLTAHISGRSVTGAELELRQAAGVDGIPIEMFVETRPQRQGVEIRADAPSLSPTTGTGVNVDPILPMIFARSVVPRIGVMMEMVGSGAYSTMTVTTGLTAAAYAAGGVAMSTASGADSANDRTAPGNGAPQSPHGGYRAGRRGQFRERQPAAAHARDVGGT